MAFDFARQSMRRMEMQYKLLTYADGVPINTSSLTNNNRRGVANITKIAAAWERGSGFVMGRVRGFKSESGISRMRLTSVDTPTHRWLTGAGIVKEEIKRKVYKLCSGSLSVLSADCLSFICR